MRTAFATSSGQTVGTIVFTHAGSLPADLIGVGVGLSAKYQAG